MNKYINQEAAVKAIAYENARVIANDSDINELMGGYNPSAFVAGFLAALTRAKDIMVSFPASDVEPVVHAHWEMVEVEGFWIQNMQESLETGKPTKAKLPVCSHCKTRFGTLALEYKRCPECGAKMDLEVKE